MSEDIKTILDEGLGKVELGFQEKLTENKEATDSKFSKIEEENKALKESLEQMKDEFSKVKINSIVKKEENFEEAINESLRSFLKNGNVVENDFIKAQDGGKTIDIDTTFATINTKNATNAGNLVPYNTIVRSPYDPIKSVGAGQFVSLFPIDSLGVGKDLILDDSTVYAYARSEMDKVDSSNLNIKVMSVRPQVYSTTVNITIEQLAYSQFNPLRFINEARSRALTDKLAYEILKGDGTRGFEGILNAQGTKTFETKSSGELDVATLEEVKLNFIANVGRDPILVISPEAFSKYRTELGTDGHFVYNNDSVGVYVPKLGVRAVMLGTIDVADGQGGYFKDSLMPTPQANGQYTAGECVAFFISPERAYKMGRGKINLSVTDTTTYSHRGINRITTHQDFGGGVLNADSIYKIIIKQ